MASVIGEAFDGDSGYGADGTIWGGEFLSRGSDQLRAVGHGCTEPVPMPSRASRHPRRPGRWRAALTSPSAGPDGPTADRAGRPGPQRAVLGSGHGDGFARRQCAADVERRAAIRRGRRPGWCPRRDQLRGPGVAIELEADFRRTCTERGSWPGDGLPVRRRCLVRGGTELRVAGSDLVLAAAEDLAHADRPASVIAARFHNGVAAAIVTVCGRLREQTGLTVVALSGGVFQNLLLTQESQVVTSAGAPRHRRPWSTARCRATTAVSASGRPWSLAPATALRSKPAIHPIIRALSSMIKNESGVAGAIGPVTPHP